jgi:hypothetical protein
MRMLPVAGLTLALLLLSGCLQQSPTAMPTPQPSSTPVFASDEEALAAAEAAYAEYLRVSDLVAQDGGKEPERLISLVTADWYPKEQESFARFAASGNRQVGSTSFKNFELQQATDLGAGAAEIVIYLCSDSSGTSFLDANGVNVTPSDRQTLVSLEVTFKTSEGAAVLQLANNEPWSGDSFC